MKTLAVLGLLCALTNAFPADMEALEGELTGLEAQRGCRVLDPQVQCARAGRRGYYPDKCDAAKFYQCVWGGESWIGEHMDCAPGTVWNQREKICVFPPDEEVAQTETIISAAVDSKACKPRDPNVVCPRFAEKRAYYADRCDATKYFQCQLVDEEWIGHHRPCAPGTVWSQPTRACVLPEAEETTIQTRALGGPEPVVDSEGRECKPIISPNLACVTIGRNGYYPHRCSRELFHQCQWTGEGWIAHVMSCAPGTVWSQWKQTCVLKGLEDKVDSFMEEEQDKPCRTRNPNKLCLKRAYYADRCNAARFYQCQQLADGSWTAHPMPCPAGTIWSQPQKTCVRPVSEEQKRELKVDEFGHPCKPVVPPSIACRTIGRDGYYPHLCSRQMYHQCVWTGQQWIAYEMHCAAGTRWSQLQETCVHDTSATRDSEAEAAEAAEETGSLPVEPAEQPSDDITDEQYAREVLSAVAEAMEKVERRGRPVRAREVSDSDAEVLARGPNRARDADAAAAAGEWGSNPLSESEEGLRPARSAACGDPCEISGTTEDGGRWTHQKRCVPGDRTKYTIVLNEESEVVMSCAYGTAFSTDTCDCTVRMIPKSEE